MNATLSPVIRLHPDDDVVIARRQLMGGTIHGLIELAAGLALIANFYAQYAAMITVVIMIGAIYFKIFKWKAPFLVMQSAGWEFDLLLLAASLVILTK